MSPPRRFAAAEAAPVAKALTCARHGFVNQMKRIGSEEEEDEDENESLNWETNLKLEGQDESL